MKYCLSLSLIPSRVEPFINFINQHDNHIKSRLVIINICTFYKRLNTNFKLDKNFLKFLKIINSKYSYQKYVLNFCDDYGPATKLIGGKEYIEKNKINVDYLIICDDDIFLHSDLFELLCDEKYRYNGITTGSGFDFNGKDYKVVEGECEMVEGYGGICFETKDFNNDIFEFLNYYKILDFKKDDTISMFLKSCFMGDDCIISQFYPSKKAVRNGRQYINPMDYGYTSDALQKNTIFDGNMGTYNFFKQNIQVFETFKNKIKLNNKLTNKVNNADSSSSRSLCSSISNSK